MNVAVAALLVAFVSTPTHTRASVDIAANFTTLTTQARDTFEVGMLRVEHLGTIGRPPLIFIPHCSAGPGSGTVSSPRSRIAMISTRSRCRDSTVGPATAAAI
jgi:hypothetical protein